MRMAVITAKVVLEQKKGHRIRNSVLEAPQFCTLHWCRATGPTPAARTQTLGRYSSTHRQDISVGAVPFGACTPLKHRVQLCPKHWDRWSILCLDPVSST